MSGKVSKRLKKDRDNWRCFCGIWSRVAYDMAAKIDGIGFQW